MDNPNLDIIWGDLTNYDDVLKGVTGADIVLHVGGMVSPQADYKPSATRRTNLSAAVNIRDAVLAQQAQPKVVYIGSVAQMGDRREPLHWGRAGDPICVSAYDHYGLTKALAERFDAFYYTKDTEPIKKICEDIKFYNVLYNEPVDFILDDEDIYIVHGSLG